jgi:cellulose synthase/poly-beta-1,6-N-acetylglucosamine synthase-like glycosyltransferase
MPDGRPWPRISVATPSFNQSQFLEATLRSILLQGYPDLEYFVFDGGSTDGSIDILKKYGPWLTKWVSERDGGQSAAVNRALALSSGLFATWINSDDMLARDALTNHASRVGFDPGVVYIGDCQYIDEKGQPLYLHRARVHDFHDLVSLRTVWRDQRRRGHIVQPEVLFPRQSALAVGNLDTRNHRTMDYQLWGNLLLAGATFQYTHICFGMFRIQRDQKTGQNWATTESLVDTAVKLVARAGFSSEDARQRVVAELRAFERECWLGTGPLARVGLPPKLVEQVRDWLAGPRRRTIDFVRRAAQGSMGAR